ncbi:MAG: hypothetical protein JOY99_04040 [Sphingomonadaceae bacterium]|nr:hypothetical protein [Sphingomonadaceae bacterium]
MLAYVPASRRSGVAALWRLDEAMARIVAQAREAALAQLRLVWWRDALAALAGDGAPPIDPLLEAVRDTVLPAVPGARLATITEGWAELLDAPDADALTRFARDRGGTLFEAAATLLGMPAWPDIFRAGEVWALVDIADRFPAALALVRERQGQGRSAPWPKPLRPLGMIAALAAADARLGRVPIARGGPARIGRMIAHRLNGRTGLGGTPSPR